MRPSIIILSITHTLLFTQRQFTSEWEFAMVIQHWPYVQSERSWNDFSAASYNECSSFYLHSSWDAHNFLIPYNFIVLNSAQFYGRWTIFLSFAVSFVFCIFHRKSEHSTNVIVGICFLVKRQIDITFSLEKSERLQW